MKKLSILKVSDESFLEEIETVEKIKKGKKRFSDDDVRQNKNKDNKELFKNIRTVKRAI